MSQAVFGADYAAAYDVLYHDKDYAAECDLIERVFAEYGDRKIQGVLDLGCGTGGHAALLAERGYTVVGVDRSADMLRRARERGITARFELGDITSFDLGETFVSPASDESFVVFIIADRDVSPLLFPFLIPKNLYL